LRARLVQPHGRRVGYGEQGAVGRRGDGEHMVRPLELDARQVARPVAHVYRRALLVRPAADAGRLAASLAVRAARSLH